MRRHTDELLDVLSGSFDRRVTVNVFHGPDRVMEDLAFESWSLSGNIDNEVTVTGSGVIVYPSVKGESLVPEGTKGFLSPFRATLELVMHITAGDFEEAVSLGLFDVTRVRSASDTFADVNGVRQVVASHVSVEVSSLEERVRRRGFRSPEQPQSTSAFSELRRITNLPVTETVTDATLTGSVWYEAKQGGRLEAVQLLGDTLGGVPVINSAGAWVIVPDTYGAAVGELRLGEHGTVTDVGYEVDTATVYNVVVGQFEDANRNEIWEQKAVLVGDLAVDGLYGENTLYITDDRVKTRAAAIARVAEVLDEVSSAQEYDVPVQCHMNPVPELGDVLEVTDWVRDLSGRLVKFQMSDSELMTVTLRVRRSL